MIFDCFMLFNELDMLECRLEELDRVVDVFVVVEALQTHQGAEKPSYFKQNSERFRHWEDRIRRVVVERFEAADSWARDREQREHIRDALVTASADDIIIVSDLDEIPTESAVRSLDERLRAIDGNEFPYVTTRQRLCVLAVDWLYPGGWWGPIAARYRDMISPNRMRDARGRPDHVIEEGGSHLSWLGGPARQVEKMDAFAHTERSIQSQRDRVERGENYRAGIFMDGTKLIPVDIDASWPKYVTEHRCPDNWFRLRTP